MNLKGSKTALLIAYSNSYITISLEDSIELVDIIKVPIHKFSMVGSADDKIQLPPVMRDLTITCRGCLIGTCTSCQHVTVGCLGRTQ